MARSDEQTNVRLPLPLKTWLQGQADRNRRSFTGEVTVRLEDSRKQQERRDAKAAA